MKVERKRLGRCLVVKFGGSSLADESKRGKAARAVAEEGVLVFVDEEDMESL